MGLVWQFVGTGVVCYLCISMGLMFTWPSSTLKLFQSENTTLSRPMTVTELSLFGSLSSIGALISTPLAGFMLDTVGRKYSCILFSIAQVLSWAIIIVFRQVEMVLTAIFISGVGAGLIVITPIYVGEFCQESIRGSMTSGSLIFYNFGMLVSYLLGGYLPYDAMVYTSLSVSIFGVIVLIPMKESPMYLMRMGREEEAAKIVAFFRSVSVRSKEVLEEMNNLRRALNPELDEPAEEEEKLQPDTKIEQKPVEKNKLSKLQFLKKSRSTRRALVVCLILMTASIFQAIIVIQVYAEPLFEEAVPDMPATWCCVLFSVLCIVGGFLGAYLSDMAGRRPLLIWSSVGSGILSAILGSQIHLQWAPQAFTAICIYVYCLVYMVGIGLMPFVLSAEVFLPEIKSFVSMLCMEWMCLCSFLVLFIFNPLVDAIGLGPTFYIFAVISLATAVYATFCVPETKGLAVDEIQKMFDKKLRNKRVNHA